MLDHACNTLKGVISTRCSTSFHIWPVAQTTITPASQSVSPCCLLLSLLSGKQTYRQEAHMLNQNAVFIYFNTACHWIAFAALLWYWQPPGMCESDNRRGEGRRMEGGGGYHEPHYVNKVQGHVPVKPQCRAKWDEAQALDGRSRGRR